MIPTCLSIGCAILPVYHPAGAFYSTLIASPPVSASTFQRWLYLWRGYLVWLSTPDRGLRVSGLFQVTLAAMVASYTTSSRHPVIYMYDQCNEETSAPSGKLRHLRLRDYGALKQPWRFTLA